MWIKSSETAKTESFWSRFTLPERHGNAGIGVIEWLNLDTGAGMALVGDGEWRTGGRFLLWYASPGATEIMDLTTLLSRRTATEFRPDPQHWNVVQLACTKIVDKFLDAADIDG